MYICEIYSLYVKNLSIKLNKTPELETIERGEFLWPHDRTVRVSKKSAHRLMAETSLRKNGKVPEWDTAVNYFITGCLA